MPGDAGADGSGSAEDRRDREDRDGPRTPAGDGIPSPFGLSTDFYTFAPESLAQLLPGFEILREVGKGSMGIVYEARRREGGPSVALKVLPPSLTLTERALARFVREGELMARIHHPAIVTVFEHGTRARLHYFVMEFVDGVTLEKRLETGPLPIRQVAALGIEVARALQYAHDHGIVHRDVKPGNLILRSDRAHDGPGPDRAAPGEDGPGRIVITDFGLARETGTGSMTESGAIVGTPMFMAPEQILGARDAVGAQIDVYGLGATLYTLLTGRVPFGGPTAQSVLRQVLDDDPLRPRTLRREVPPALEAVILKAMEKDPADRYGTASDMADDLARFLATGRVEAQLPGPVTRGLRAVRRRPLPFALTALVLGLVAVVLLLQWDRAVRDLESRIAAAEGKLVRAALGRDDQMRPLSAAERENLLLQASVFASEVLAQDPAYGRAHFVRAKARHRLGSWGEALADLDAAARRLGPSPELLTWRIDTLRHLRDDASRARLLEDLNTLLELDDGPGPRSLVAGQLMDLAAEAEQARRTELMALAERVLTGIPQPSPQALLLRARQHELEGDRTRALETMREAVDTYRGDFQVHAQASEMYRRLGLLAESRAEAAIVRGSGAVDPGGEARPPAFPVDTGALRGFLDDLEAVLQKVEGGQPDGQLHRRAPEPADGGRPGSDAGGRDGRDDRL